MAAIKFFLLIFALMSPGTMMADAQLTSKPVIHLDGVMHTSISLPANKVITLWSYSGANGIKQGGMTYGAGYITVPTAGIYYVYCQVYYNTPNGSLRHGIYVNNNRLPGLASYDASRSGSLHTGMAVKLNQGDKLSCKIIYPSNVWIGAAHTFFGAYLL